MVSLLLLGVLALLLAVPPVLAGCRKAEPQGGGTLEPLRVVVSDLRRLYPRASCAPEPAEYLDTTVSPGQNVLVGEGNFSINLYWATRVKMEGIQPFIVVDPPPTSGWNWMPELTVRIVPESTVGSALQLSYWQDQFTVPKFNVTLKAGLSLGGTETLAQDFVFTITRAPEPIMTASVTGFPWAKTPYDRLVAGYVLPAGRYEVRFEFSPAPDPAAAESALLASAQGVVDSRWADDHTFVVTLDLASGADEAVFNVNGVAVPGTICLARIEPLVLAGKEKTALACFEDPGNPSCKPKLTALPLPLDAGKLAIGGERALLLESVRNLDISEDGPDVVPVPWVVDTRTGEARCLEGPFESNPIGMLLGMYGWVADGRLVLPLRDGSTVMPDVGSSSFEGGDWPIIEANAMDIGPCLSRSVSPDGRRLAWLELKVDATGSSGTMRLVVADPATRQWVEDYPAATPAVLYDGETWQRPPILWSPVGSICLPPQETLPAAQFRVLDEASGVFVTQEFLAPDGKPLEALAWTVHSGQEDWLARGRAVGYAVGSQELVLVSASGRRPLGLTKEGDPSPILGAAFSPDGSFLAVQAGNKVCLFRCPGGEKVRDVKGQYLGFAADGQLWLVVPAAGD